MGKPERAVAVAQPPLSLPKARTGIDGLDEITGGGLPQGRPTLVCGGPGCGKTLLAMEFLVRGATAFDEPGAFIAFEETPEGNQCVVGYFVVDGPDDEEISAKLGGGPHNDSNPDWADTHDIGIINFVGDRARVRWEETHPDYQSAESQDVNGIGDIRGDWVGAMGCKLNLDEDGDGETDHIWYLGWVDPEGLDADGNPLNGWVQVLDATFAVEDVGLKSPTVPYVTTIGEAGEAQATIRIDEQGDDYAYEHIAYRSPIACVG